MRNIFMALAIIGAASAASAQDQAAQLPDSSKSSTPTKLESFSAKTGIVVIKGYSNIATVAGLGQVLIDAREFRDASNPKVGQYGVAITVKEAGRLERESISFIDEDEIDSLIRGLDYISKMDRGVTTLGNFEAQYRTKGDFSVTVFSERTGTISLAVSSGRIGKASAYLKLADAALIKNALVEAQRTLAAAKQPR